MDLGGRWVGYTFGAIGAGLLIAAVYMYRTDNELAIKGQTALGIVVDFRWEKGGRRATGGRGSDPRNFDYYREPIVRFTTRTGQTIQFPAISANHSEGLKVGDTIEVVYLPENPDTVDIKGSERLSTAALVFAIMGSAFLIPTIVLNLVPALKRRRRAADLARAAGDGNVISAKVSSVRRIHPADVGGAYSIQIVAHWRNPASGKMQEFESGAIELDTKGYAKEKGLPVWVEPSKQLFAEIEQKLRGRGMRVRIDAGHPDGYVMETPRLRGLVKRQDRGARSED